MKRALAYGGIAILVLLVAIQFVPVADAGNPPVEAEIDAPADVRAVLRRSCYDCHSNETRWPWYSRVAPASWLVQRDVREGREHLNFSTWGRYDREERAEHVEEIAEEALEGEMPPWFYIPLHPDAQLSDADAALLERWTGARHAVASAASASRPGAAAAGAGG